jgi:hypothetical protein
MSCAHLQKWRRAHPLPASDARINDSSSISNAMREDRGVRFVMTHIDDRWHALTRELGV